jgi:hypothetical protein
MGFDHARHEPQSTPGEGNDQAEFSWSSVAKTLQGVANNPAVSAIGKTALQMAPSVLGGAATGAMAGGPIGALLGGGGAVLSGLLGQQPGAQPAGTVSPIGAPMPQMAGAQFPQLPPQLAQFAPIAAQLMPALPAAAQSTLGPVLQLLQNPQLAGLLAAFGGSGLGGAAAMAGAGARESEPDPDQESVYDYLVGNGFAAES